MALPVVSSPRFATTASSWSRRGTWPRNSQTSSDAPDFDATGSEWRTPPLWGIGLVATVNRHSFFLHDGRARNFVEAVLWHGGEAAKSRDAFSAMNKEDREALVKFVEAI